MSWEIVSRTAKQSRPALSRPVAVSVMGSKAIGDRILITIRPSMLDSFSWWDKDLPVAVKVGRGEHAGQIRLEPGKPGDMVPRRTGKQLTARVPAASLSVVLPRGSAPKRITNCEVEFDYTEDWIEITLPKQPVMAAADGAVLNGKGAAPPTLGYRTQATATGMAPKVGGR